MFFFQRQASSDPVSLQSDAYITLLRCSFTGKKRSPFINALIHFMSVANWKCDGQIDI